MCADLARMASGLVLDIENRSPLIPRAPGELTTAGFDTRSLFQGPGSSRPDPFGGSIPHPPQFRLLTLFQEPIDLVEQQVVMVNFGFGLRVLVSRGIIPVEVIVRSGEHNTTTTGELAVQPDYCTSAVWQ